MELGSGVAACLWLSLKSIPMVGYYKQTDDDKDFRKERLWQVTKTGEPGVSVSHFEKSRDGINPCAGRQSWKLVCPICLWWACVFFGAIMAEQQLADLII